MNRDIKAWDILDFNLCCNLFTGCWLLGHLQNRSMKHFHYTSVVFVEVGIASACRISCIAMRLFVDITECLFLKVIPLDEGKLGAVFSQEKVRSNARLYPTTWTRRSKYAKLLRVVKYARTSKSIMRPPLLCIKIPESRHAEIAYFLDDNVTMITI